MSASDPAPTWHTQAVCAQVDPTLWTDTPGGGEGRVMVEQAVELCRGCPVWRECRLEGLGEAWHTWGGLPPRIRQSIRNAMGIWSTAGFDPIDAFRDECVEAARAHPGDIEAAYRDMGCEGLLDFDSRSPAMAGDGVSVVESSES